jgi:60 kDa SS-A/Ro ribonucleoprotein
LFRDSVGNDPSLADVIKMAHPSPRTTSREALYAYICGKKVVYKQNDMESIKLKDGRSYATTVLFKNLPECVQAFEVYKKNALAGNHAGDVPNVPFQLLTALNLGTKEWTGIAKTAPWQMTRMNLNTFERHGVFKNDEMVKLVADRLANKELVLKSKCFPYQLLSAYKNVEGNVPSKIINALQDAVEHATDNVPEVSGKVYICIDVSGSMHSAVTGSRGTATSKVSCLDVAALMAASLARKNKEAEIIPFHNDVVQCNINSRDSIMTNATKLAGLPSGGTSCSAPIKHLNDRNAKGDLIIMISDNESWADMQRSVGRGYGSYGGTSAQVEWLKFKARNKNSRFVAIDVQPNSSMQVQEQKDVLNVGGFSDVVFDIVGAFAKGELENGHWVGVIEKEVIGESPLANVAKTGAKKAIAKNFKQPRKSNGRFAAKDNRKLS